MWPTGILLKGNYTANLVIYRLALFEVKKYEYKTLGNKTNSFIENTFALIADVRNTSTNVFYKKSTFHLFFIYDILLWINPAFLLPGDLRFPLITF